VRLVINCSLLTHYGIIKGAIFITVVKIIMIYLRSSGCLFIYAYSLLFYVIVVGVAVDVVCIVLGYFCLNVQRSITKVFCLFFYFFFFCLLIFHLPCILS